MTELLDRAAYLPFIVLTAIGLYLMLAHRNFIKALVGLQVFQTAIILFFIVMAVRDGGTIPIMNELKHGAHAVYTGDADSHHVNDHHDAEPSPSPALEGRGDKAKPSHYDEATVMHNPLPHALMLTAIVVGVATQGVGLAILRRLKDETGTIEDTEREVA